MDYLLDHRTINMLRIVSLIQFVGVCILLIPNLLYASTMSKASISFEAEQQHWRQWIGAHDDNTCPLQPFIFGGTQAKLELAERLIKKLGTHDNVALFVRVNIDNGILKLAYLTWDEPGGLVYSIEGDGLKGKFTLSQDSVTNHVVIRLLNDLPINNDIVDLKNRKIFDADSMYLTVVKKGKITRYASYGPEIIHDQVNEVSLRQFAEYVNRLAKISNEPDKH